MLGCRYSRWSGAITPRSDAMLRITPWPRRAMAPPNTCEQSIAPVSPTAISVCHCGTGKASKRDECMTPGVEVTLGSIAALLTRMSTAMPRPARSSPAAPTDFCDVTSMIAETRSALGAISFTAAMVASACAGPMSLTTTRAPASTRAATCCRPSSPPAPVTSAVRPVRSYRAEGAVMMRSCSSTQLSAVGHDHGARDEGRAGGGEQGDDICDLFGLAEPAQRHLAIEHLVHGGFVFGDLARPGAVGAENIARRNGVDADAFERQRAGKAAHGRVQGRLRSRIGHRCAERRRPTDRRHADDR